MTVCDESRVGLEVRFDHAIGAEALHGATPYGTAVERQHALEPVYQGVERVENPAGHTVIDELAGGAASKRGNGRSARHGLRDHQPKGLT